MPNPSPRPAPHRCLRLAGYLALVVGLLFASMAAQAIPAYARQTGSACADCHAGAYGPTLTPYGMRFKMGGYTDTDGQGTKIPIAGQLTESHFAPAKGPSDTSLTEADLYLAGRVSDNVGGYVKVEADHTGHNTYNTRLANIDIRFVAKELKFNGKDMLVGVSVNNSPGFQDPVSDLPGASLLGPTGSTGTFLNVSAPGSPANRVIGTTVYGLYDGQWYGEVGTYRSLPESTQDHLGYTLGGDPGRIHDTGYARFTWMKDMKHQFFSAGVVALTTKRQLPRSGPADNLTDLGYDATYQYLGNRKHIVQLTYVNIMEKRKYGTPLPDPTRPDGLSQRHAVVHDQTMAATYTFLQTYGVTFTHMLSTGPHDNARYPPFGNPDTTTNYITVFWAPFGKDDSYTSIANLKIAASWFRFTRINGRSNNVNGAPPGVRGVNAGDNNAFTVSASVAF